MAERPGFAQEIQIAFDAAREIKTDKLLFSYNGVLYPAVFCNAESFKAIESFEAREDDILFMTYPKCGLNWTLQLLNSMIEAKYNKPTSSLLPILEFGNLEKIKKLKEEPSPRVIITYLFYDDIPKTIFDKKAKKMVLTRNPKDTAVSFFHFHNTNPMLPTYNSWDKFLQDFIGGKVCCGSYFDHLVEWNKHADDDGVLFITYEEMKQDLETAIKKISDFFGFSLTPEQVQQIAYKGTFKLMKEKGKETHGDMGHCLFRKGEVGDWKNHFSEAQSKEFDAIFGERLAGTKLGKMLNYDVYCK